jgi:hypothetical protein
VNTFQSLPEDTAEKYGNLIFIFRPHIYPRVTYTLGDSLDIGGGHGALRAYPLSYLKPLMDYDRFGLEINDNSPDDSYSYIEAQIWGTLTLHDVSEIWITSDRADLDSSDINLLKKIAEVYHIKICQVADSPDAERQPSLINIISRPIDLYSEFKSATSLSDGPDAVPAAMNPGFRPRELINRFIELSSKATEEDDDDIEVEKGSYTSEMNIIAQILSQHGYLHSLPENLAKKVSQFIMLTQRNLQTLAVGPEMSSQVRAAALSALAQPDAWPSPWYSSEDAFALVERLQDPHFFLSIRPYFRSPEDFLRQLGGIALPTVDGKVITTLIQKAYTNYLRTLNPSDETTSHWRSRTTPSEEFQRVMFAQSEREKANNASRYAIKHEDIDPIPTFLDPENKHALTRSPPIAGVSDPIFTFLKIKERKAKEDQALIESLSRLQPLRIVEPIRAISQLESKMSGLPAPAPQPKFLPLSSIRLGDTSF